MNRKNITIIILVLLGAAAVGAFLYIQIKDSTEVNNVTSTPAEDMVTSTVHNEDQPVVLEDLTDAEFAALMDTSTWKVYENEELEVRLYYPKKLIDISNNETINSYSNSLRVFASGDYLQMIDENGIEIRIEPIGFVSSQEQLGNFDYNSIYSFLPEDDIVSTLTEHFELSGFDNIPIIKVLDENPNEYYVIFESDVNTAKFLYFNNILDGTLNLYVTNLLDGGVSLDDVDKYIEVAQLVATKIEKM